MLPSVISMIPGEHSEMVDLDTDRSPNAQLTEFLRNSFSHQYRNVTSTEFFEGYKDNTKKDKVYLVGSANIPIPFLYVSHYYKEDIQFYRTDAKDKRAITKHLDEDNVFAVFTPSKFSGLKPKMF